MTGIYIIFIFSFVYLVAVETNESPVWSMKEKVLSESFPSTREMPTKRHNGTHGTKKFEVITSVSLSWTDALAYCKERKTELATIRNQEENDAVVDLIKKTGFGVGDVEVHIWIGGTDLQSARGFFWMTDGDSVNTYENWHKGEPNHWRGIEHCMDYRYAPVDYGNKYIKWNDDKCYKELPFVCQYYV